MIKLGLMLLVVFSTFGCDSAPAKKPAPARVPVDVGGGGGNQYQQPYQQCTAPELKDTVTGVCSQPCSNNSARSNGQCSNVCSGNAVPDASGKCPNVVNNNLCPGQQTVTTQFYNSGLPQDIQQNYNNQYGQTQGQVNQQVALPAGSAYQCQFWDQNCVQQTSSSGQSCIQLDTTGRCINFAQTSTLTTTTGTSPQLVTCTYAQPGLTNNQSGISSCFPQGVNPMMGAGYGAGYGANMYQSGGLGLDPMYQGMYNSGQIFNPYSQQLGGQFNPLLMGQRYPQMAGTYSQLSLGFNAMDPLYRGQLGFGSTPLMLSANPAQHCQMYNQMMYRNMMMAQGADPCLFAQNSITAFMCVGKGIVDTFRMVRDPVRRERVITRVDEVDPLDDDPIPLSQVATPAQTPAAPEVKPTPAVVTTPSTTTTTPTTKPEVKSTPRLGGQSRSCLIDKTPLAGEVCNGGSARVIQPVQSGQSLKLASNAAGSMNNEADFAIQVQVVRDQASGQNRLKFFSNEPGVKVKVKFVSGAAEAIRTGPIIWANVQWTVRGKTYCGVQNNFQISIWSQPKPLSGVECGNGGVR
jgi:hypothetical protein